jgi:hypothetical protein
MGPGGARARSRGGSADTAEHRLRRVSLVPRDGARVIRERRDRTRHERSFRQREGRSGRTTRSRQHIHAGRSGDDRTRRLADDCFSDTARRAVLRRHVLPARGPPGTPGLQAGPRVCIRCIPQPEGLGHANIVTDTRDVRGGQCPGANRWCARFKSSRSCLSRHRTEVRCPSRWI